MTNERQIGGRGLEAIMGVVCVRGRVFVPPDLAPTPEASRSVQSCVDEEGVVWMKEELSAEVSGEIRFEHK